MIVSNFNGGNVAWYHVHPARPTWVVRCPHLELILAWENLKTLGESPTLLDAVRISGMDLAEVQPEEIPELLEWFASEVLDKIPLSYKIWLTYVYEVSGQKISPEDIAAWGTQPIRLLVSAFDLIVERKLSEAKSAKSN